MNKPIETPVDGKAAIVNYLIDATKAELNALPDGVLEKLRSFANETSPVAASCNAAEMIYARADELPVDLLAIGAELATMGAIFGFHGLGDDARGHGIAKALRARDGVAKPVPMPKASQAAPEPLEAFLAPQEAPEGVEEAPALPEPPKGA